MDFLGEVKANVIKLLMFGHHIGIFAVEFVHGMTACNKKAAG